MRALRFALPSSYVLLMACGPATTVAPPKPVPPAPAPKVEAKAPVEHPARWAVLPGGSRSMRARVDLADAGALYLGEGGERWLDKRDGTPPKPADAFLPEGLVGATKTPAGIALVGNSGTVYVIDAPLSPVKQRNAPPIGTRSVAVGGGAVIVIAGDGTAMRSTDAGATWTKLSLPGSGGVLESIAMNDAGLALALFAPQRVVASSDAGATWTPLVTPSIGARAVLADGNGNLSLLGLEAAAALRTSPLRLERMAKPPAARDVELPGLVEGTSLTFGASLENGRGAIVEDKFYEVSPEVGDETIWRLSITTLGGATKTHRVSELPSCKAAAVAALGKSVWIACEEGVRKGGAMSLPGIGGKRAYVPTPPEDKVQVRVFFSSDGGSTFQDDGSVQSSAAAPRLWASDDGGLLLIGGCKKSKTAACSNRDSTLVRPPGSKQWARIGLPHNVAALETVSFGANGAAFAVGRGATVGSNRVLLASKNHGRDFAAVAVPGAPVETGNGSFARADHASVGVDESGAVGIAAQVSPRKFAVWIGEAGGDKLVARAVPFDVDAVTMVGKRGLGYSTDGRSFETSDGGVTWSQSGAPSTHAKSSEKSALIWCNPWACVVGDHAARVGWGAAPGDAPKGTASSRKLASATPMRCTADGAWTTLGPLFAPPTAYDADVAPGTRWMVLRDERKNLATSVIASKGFTKDGRIDSRDISLFGPAATDTATTALPQIEGAAALRYSFKREPTAKGSTTPGAILATQKIDVEVAWYVAATGKVHRAVIRDAQGFDPKDVLAVTSGPALAQIGLLSIAQGGIHVRPFATRGDAPLYFVSEAGKVEKLRYPDLPRQYANGEALTLRIDALRVGDRSVVIGISGGGLQVTSAWSSASGGWEQHTWGLFPEVPGDSGELLPEVAWDLSIIGGKPTMVASWPGSAQAPAVAVGAVVEPQADPEKISRLPTQAEMSDPPKACEPASISAPRTVAPWASGKRHPVMVSGEGSELMMATSSASLRSPSTGTCVGAYEAVPVGETTAYSALVFPDDLGRSLLFRYQPEETSVRTMKCTWAAGTELPSAYADAEGFSAK